MTDTFEMSPPPPPEKPDRSKYWKWGAIGVGALFVISLIANSDSNDSSSSTAPAPVPTVQRAASPAPTTTTQRRITESDVQMMTLDATGLESFIRNDICPNIRDLLREGYRRADLIEFAIEAFEEGFGERLYPEPRARFIRALDAC